MTGGRPPEAGAVGVIHLMLDTETDEIEITLTKFAFDQYWTMANISRIELLMAHEIEALVEYHWRLLVKEAQLDTAGD